MPNEDFDKLFITPEEAQKRLAARQKTKHRRCVCDRCRASKVASDDLYKRFSAAMVRNRRLVSVLMRIRGEVRVAGIE